MMKLKMVCYNLIFKIFLSKQELCFKNNKEMAKMEPNSTLMIEDSVNGLQFQIRQEPGPNGQITYKVVPMNSSNETLQNSENQIPLDQPQVIVTNAPLIQQTAPVYLMVPTNEICSPSSQTKSTKSQKQFGRTIRDEKRRANHNEVERRRRDNINKWIVELSKVIPDCSNDHTKHGQSKGGILEKTVQYLQDLKTHNQQLIEQLRNMDRIKIENELLKEENQKLHQTMNKITSLSQTTNLNGLPSNNNSN